MKRFVTVLVTLGALAIAAPVGAQAATLTATPECVESNLEPFLLSGEGLTPNSNFDVDIYNSSGYHTTILEGTTDASGAFGPLPDNVAEFVTYGSFYPADGTVYELKALVSISGNLVEEASTTIQFGNCTPPPPPPPTTTEQCKNGGWKAFPGFTNQGDCVSFVATKGKNPPGK